MMSKLIRVGLALLVLNKLLSPCTALRSYGNKNYNNKYVGRGYNDAEKPKTFTGTSSGLPSQNPTRRGLGISAWGIVTVVITIILAGMGFYYFSMCYPILCKKERKYDIIELTNV